jgi:HD-GYP domain-containing protein (c-di-GMP phosphodiesterase class II)
MRTARMTAITDTYTCWDDMAAFVNKPTGNWATNNLAPALDTYDADTLWVFDKSMHQVYGVSRTPIDNLKQAPLSSGLRNFVKTSGPNYHFFVMTKAGLMEVFGGSIHPADSADHLGAAKGYLFVGKMWSTQYLSEIKDITQSREIELSYASNNSNAPEAPTEFDKIFRSWNGDRVATLIIMADDSATGLMQQSINEFLYVIVVFSLVLLAVILICLNAWVTRPMDTLSQAMSEQSMKPAIKLLKDRAEIGAFANMMSAFFKQKDLLTKSNELLEVRVGERTAALTDSNRKLIAAYDATIEGWSRALDLRDRETEGHSRRVTAMTLMLGRSFGLTDSELRDIERGAMLHDIGKMGVPDNILMKEGPLSEDEWDVMRRHPQFALDMLMPISFLRKSLDIPYCHHEKWDGTGYPNGLKEEEIPFAARMFAIADVWDALTTERPYKQAWPISKVREHFKSLAGTHFDPQVVEMLLELTEDNEADAPLQRAA